MENFRGHDDERAPVLAHAFADGAHDLAIAPAFKVGRGQVRRVERAHRRPIFAEEILPDEGKLLVGRMTPLAKLHELLTARNLLRGACDRDIGYRVGLFGVQLVETHQPQRQRGGGHQSEQARYNHPGPFQDRVLCAPGAEVQDLYF